MCILKLQSYSIILKKRQKVEKIAFFYKKVSKNFANSEKSTTFAPAIRNKRVLKTKFGVWCNGNTADSGPAFPGSSPGTPTKREMFARASLFSLLYILSYFMPRIKPSRAKRDGFKHM